MDVNSRDEFGYTPLVWAAKGGYEAVVQQLLKRGGVNVNSKDIYGYTPLAWAANEGHEAVVRLLVLQK